MKQKIMITNILSNIISQNELCTIFCQKVFNQNFIKYNYNDITFKYDYSIIATNIMIKTILLFIYKNKIITANQFYKNIDFNLDYNDLLIQKLIFKYII